MRSRRSEEGQRPRDARNSVAAVASTVVSSSANVLIQLLGARLLTVDAYARFVLAAATILFVVGLSGNTIGQIDLIRGNRGPDTRFPAAALVFSFLTLIGGIALSVAAWGIGNNTLLIIGVSLLVSSCFVLQSTARFRAFRVERASWALVSDGVVLALVLGVLVVFHGEMTSALRLLLVWAAASGVGFMILAPSLRYWGSAGAASEWWRDNRDLAVPGSLEYFLQSSVPYLLNWVILLLGGAVALAGYRIVQLLFAGVGNLAQGLNAFEIPQLTHNPTGERIRWMLLRNAVLLLFPAAILFLLVHFISDDLGVLFFGASWYGVMAFLAPGALHGYINALLVFNFQALRILGEARYSLVVRVVTVLLTFPVCYAFGRAFGAVGIAWGLAFVTVLGYTARLLRTLERTQGLAVTS